MCPKIKVGTNAGGRGDKKSQQPPTRAAQPVLAPKQRQSRARRQPERDSRRRDALEAPPEYGRRLVPRHHRGVLPRIINGPEPELSEHTRAPQHQAAQGKRQHHARAENGRRHQALARRHSPLAQAPHRPRQKSPQCHQRRVLLHQYRCAKQQTGGQRHPQFSGLPRPPHGAESAGGKKRAKMRGMSRQAQHIRAGGQHGIGGGRHDAGHGLEQIFGQPEQHQRRGRGQQQYAQMNPRRRFSEQRHDHGISGVCAGELHVERQLVGRYALQHELAGVRVFALVAFQRKIQQPQPRHGHQHQRGGHEPPGPMPVKQSGRRGRRGMGRRHAPQLNKSAAWRQADLPPHLPAPLFAWRRVAEMRCQLMSLNRTPRPSFRHPLPAKRGENSPKKFAH